MKSLRPLFRSWGSAKDISPQPTVGVHRYLLAFNALGAALWVRYRLGQHMEQVPVWLKHVEPCLVDVNVLAVFIRLSYLLRRDIGGAP